LSLRRRDPAAIDRGLRIPYIRASDFDRRGQWLGREPY
jgi:hypothetical protein